MSRPRTEATPSQAEGSQDSALTSSGATDAEDFWEDFRSRKRLRRLGNFSPSDLLAEAPETLQECNETQLEIEGEVGLDENHLVENEVIPNDNQAEIPFLNEGGGHEGQMVQAEMALEHAHVPEAPIVNADSADAPPTPRTRAHRENSRAWHATWEKKGVPKKRPGEQVVPEPQAITSLRDAQHKFVAEWISNSAMPASHARRACALRAWMESETRANLMATRSGLQS